MVVVVVVVGSSDPVEAETTDLIRRREGDVEEKEEAMMQPRDAHDDGDCAMEEAGGHSSPLPPVMTTKTGIAVDASSPSSNHHAPADEIHQRTASPLSVDAALVGARKRKALRVVKHQQQVRLLPFFPSII